MDERLFFEVKAYLGVIQEYHTGWRKELNLISWGNGPVKFDIRDWSPDHERMSRGVTMTEKEMGKMLDIVATREERIQDVFSKERADMDIER